MWLMYFLIAALFLLSVIAAFTDKEGRVIASMAETVFAYGLIFAVMKAPIAQGGVWLCALASLAWTIGRLARSDARWR